MTNSSNAASAFGHSAQVRIELHVNGSRLRVAKLGPNRAYLFDAKALAPGPAELVVEVDGEERRQSVILRPGPTADRIVPIDFPAS